MSIIREKVLRIALIAGLVLGSAATLLTVFGVPWTFASRNGSGTYTLPAGNPVVTNTTITSTWANNTLSDLGTEMTDSLDRSGKGGMLAALSLTNGTVGTPALNFTSQTNTGLYRAAASDMRCSLNGTDAQRWTTTANFLYGPGGSVSLTGTYSGVALIAGGAGASSSTNETNAGVVGVGGTSGGFGVVGLGGSVNGTGVFGTGQGTAAGVSGTGGGTSGPGLSGTGGAGAGNGVTALGTGSGLGIGATGGTTGVGGQFANGTAATAATRQDAATLTNGDLNMSGVVNPNSTVGFTNRLSPKNIPKAWGKLTTDGAGNVSVADGFNLTSVALADTNTTLLVTLTTGLANTNYAVDFVCSASASSCVPWLPHNAQTTTTFKMSGFLLASTPTITQVNFSNTATTVHFAVFGAQ